VKDSRWWCR